MAEALATYIYVDTAFGALNRRNRVRAINDIDFHETGPERYISHRRASEDLVTWTRTHTNSMGNPTIEGFDGKVWDSSLPFDFDDRADPAHALAWVREFLEHLGREDVQLDALRYYFSGAKGFHVEIPHTLFGTFEPSEQLHVWEKAAALELMGGIPFDTAVYDKLRLWRLTNTLNAKGQRYKVQLSVQEVLERSMAEILELAAAPRPRLPSVPDLEWMPNDYLAGVWQRAQGIAEAQATTTEVTPPTWSDERGNAVMSAATAAAIAESWPHSDTTISRHSDYLLPLSGFLARQMGPEMTAAVLKDAALQAADKSFLEDRTRHWEDEIERLASSSAQKIASNEKVEGLPTIAKRWPELADFLATHYLSFGNTANTANTAKQKGFQFTSLEDALAEPPEQTAFLVEDMLPSGGVSLWGAKPKVGKSVMVRNLAIQVSHGEPFLGRACKQGTVLVLALEEKRAEVINHFRRMGGIDESLHLHIGAAPNSSKEGMQALASAIAIYQPALVIVDPVFKLIRVKDSSDYAELTRELEPVIELARNTGCHIALTHHLGKAAREGGDDVLGSTAIFGAVDTLVLMRRLKDNQRTLATIQRYGRDINEAAVPMDENSGTVGLGALLSVIKISEAKAEVLAGLMKFQPDYWCDQTKAREVIKLDRNMVIRALKELAEEGALEATGEGVRGNPWRYRVAQKLRSPDLKSDSNFPYAVFLKEYSNTAYGNGPEIERACKACGQALSDAEVASGWGLHFQCTLPMQEEASS